VRLGLFGGTFDPPHVGHLLAASDAFEALALDCLLLIPAAQQPLKVGRASAPAEHRLAMLRLAAGGDARLRVDALEIDRRGLSFTVDTLEEYARRDPDAQRFLLVGADVLETFAQWRSPERILALATLAILERGEDGVTPESREEWVPVRTGRNQADGTTTSARARRLRTRRVDVSSTEIRARVRDGRPLTGFVPDAVAAYIREHGLYR
jgi:nicotinate-nucleotide adenylyltransferase